MKNFLKKVFQKENFLQRDTTRELILKKNANRRFKWILSEKGATKGDCYSKSCCGNRKIC